MAVSLFVRPVLHAVLVSQNHLLDEDLLPGVQTASDSAGSVVRYHSSAASWDDQLRSVLTNEIRFVLVDLSTTSASAYDFLPAALVDLDLRLVLDVAVLLLVDRLRLRIVLVALRYVLAALAALVRL